jgi:para-nitrobenzyl esterase
MLGADLATMLGASHGFEIPFVFGHFELGREGNIIFTDRNEAGRQELSSAMRGYWAEFARTGKPGRGGKPNGVEWTAWDASAPSAPKFAVLDTPLGGGVRMSNETLTTQSVLDSLAADQRLADPRDKCAVYYAMANFSRGFTKAQYRALPLCQDYPFEKYPWS